MLCAKAGLTPVRRTHRGVRHLPVHRTLERFNGIGLAQENNMQKKNDKKKTTVTNSRYRSPGFAANSATASRTNEEPLSKEQQSQRMNFSELGQ